MVDDLQEPARATAEAGQVGPIQSKIYLHKVDEFVEKVLIPEYTRGRVRKQSRDFGMVWYAIQCARKRDDRTTVCELREQLHSMPSGALMTPATGD
ncbi:hypothetical protein ACWCQQ_33670 [Streptomyces sp. NPDC002143]